MLIFDPFGLRDDLKVLDHYLLEAISYVRIVIYIVNVKLQCVRYVLAIC